MSVWAEYPPNDSAPWNLQRVVHLHRRAAFGATWTELQRDLADGPGAAVSRLLDGRSRLAGVPEDFESLSAVIGQAAVDSGNADRLKAWWLYRCLFTPHPLQERLTLMWHNHFATSNLKVDNLSLMKRQNETLRKHALGSFRDLLAAMSHDAALLVWLDASQNRKEHPNENLARELMELFTLGIGHYTEDDVKQAARALTGWSVRQGEFRDQRVAHDNGEKEILGHHGKWTGDDLIHLLRDQPHTAHRLAWRLMGEFFGEGVVNDIALNEFAEGLQKNKLDIRWAVETILRSELFFSSTNIGSRIADPVSFAIGPLIALESWRSPPSTLALAEWISRMGQELFYPPNVGGWPGGRAWLTTRAVLARTNFAAALVAGQLASPVKPPDFPALMARHVGATESNDCTKFVARLLYGRDCERAIQTALELLTAPEAHLH
jgi:uncharacterized protein (DUF1800 family)